jgi:hypothetical protein
MIFIKLVLLLLTLTSFFLSGIFLFAPKVFSRIEKFIASEFGIGSKVESLLEGDIDLNIFNKIMFKFRFYFGPLLILLSGYAVVLVVLF